MKHFVLSLPPVCFVCAVEDRSSTKDNISPFTCIRRLLSITFKKEGARLSFKSFLKVRKLRWVKCGIQTINPRTIIFKSVGTDAPNTHYLPKRDSLAPYSILDRIEHFVLV